MEDRQIGLIYKKESENDDILAKASSNNYKYS